MVNYLNTCGECPFVRRLGTCRLSGDSIVEDRECVYIGNKPINREIAIKVLHYHQKWRRGYEGRMVNSVLLGKSIDLAIRCLRNKNVEHEGM